MTRRSIGTGATGTSLARTTALLAEIGDLKRVRVAGRVGSLAERGFARGWGRLVAGEAPGDVARSEAAAAVCAARLAGIDAAVLRRVGVDHLPVLRAAFDEVAPMLPVAGRDDLRAALDGVGRDGAGTSSAVGAAVPELPPLVAALTAQPRAGATCPGLPRLVLEPPESHGDHCWATAVYGALLAPALGADPGAAYALGIAHHLHNAVLPDAGYTGESLLGDHLGGVLARLTAEALASLPPPLAGWLRDLLAEREHADTPLARTFHTADVLDRVLQMRQYERVAAFTLDQALGDLQLVHAGPVQDYQLGVLDEAGLWPAGVRA